MRVDGRKFDELRKIEIQPNYMLYAEGSALITWGNNKIVCTASWEPKVPFWLKDSGRGWVTAEYSMLPRSSPQRITRDIVKGTQASRGVEIQRLIGRAIRSVIDLEALANNSITIDCDVIQADGGTRCASIVGGFVALVLALRSINIKKIPVKDYLGAVSVGIIDRNLALDLCYDEDYRAFADINVVADGSGNLAEVQATAENGTFKPDDFANLLDLAKTGIAQIIEIEKTVLGALQ